MRAARIFLGISALVWLPYGIFCFFVPSYLGEAAGVVSQSPTASTELRAMYGGLQVAIGSLAALALVRPAFVAPALLMLAFLCTGLALGRLGGTVFDGGVTAYTIVGLGFEIISSALAILLLSRLPAWRTAASRA